MNYVCDSCSKYSNVKESITKAKIILTKNFPPMEEKISLSNQEQLAKKNPQ